MRLVTYSVGAGLLLVLFGLAWSLWHWPRLTLSVLLTFAGLGVAIVALIEAREEWRVAKGDRMPLDWPNGLPGEDTGPAVVARIRQRARQAAPRWLALGLLVAPLVTAGLVALVWVL
jgi:hypothetical protein